MANGHEQRNLTTAAIKKLVESMRDLDVAEFEYQGLKVKFFKEVKLPGQPVTNVNDLVDGGLTVDPDLKSSLETHLEQRSPSRAEDEHQRDLYWSSGAR